jgi:hypothetical protein
LAGVTDGAQQPSQLYFSELFRSIWNDFLARLHRVLVIPAWASDRDCKDGITVPAGRLE